MRTLTIFVLNFTVLASLPLLTRSDDYGPRGDIRAVRGDTRVLLLARARAWQGAHPSIVVDSVIVEGDAALAHWTAGERSGIEGVVRIYDRWWERLTVFGPAESPLSFRAAGFSPDIIALASAHFPQVSASPTTESQVEPTAAPVPLFAAGTNGTNLSGTLDGYRMQLSYPANDAASTSTMLVTARRPTHAESWLARGGNSYCFFTMTFAMPTALHMPQNSSIDIWFPYVLDDGLRYSLTIAHADAPIGPITGTLHDNTLHFALPAFIITPGSELMAEIESP